MPIKTYSRVNSVNLVCLISCHVTTVYVAEVCSVKLNRNTCNMDDLHHDKFPETLSITRSVTCMHDYRFNYSSHT